MSRATTIEQTQPSASDVNAPQQRLQSAWSAALACWGFFMISVVLVRAYSMLHWDIIRDHRSALDEVLKADLLRVLSHLEIYRLTAILSVVFGIWSFGGEPRWIRWLCLPVILLAALLCLVSI
jgi:hypothetical protein